ncbi:MAG: hypothetical protein A2X94_08870 [Bdellovibrionales bacterium GWB1_55_8]|nr:MAG: hypothetical protein A2X94_08870 [Bdellovibrionales bacterium GWB1_55_8]
MHCSFLKLSARVFRPLTVLLFSLLWGGCATVVSKPCLTGGEPAIGADEKPIGGSRQCEQAKDRSGRFVNHGNYIEWYPSGRRAIEGEYRFGARHGKWTRWDQNGKIISEKFYNEGAEVTLSPKADANR